MLLFTEGNFDNSCKFYLEEKDNLFHNKGWWIVRAYVIFRILRDYKRQKMPDKVMINFADERELKNVGVGSAVARNILQHRTIVGNVTPHFVGEIKHLRVT